MPNGRIYGVLAAVLFLAAGVNGLRLARLAEKSQLHGVFFLLARMSPVQVYVASALLLALGLGLIATVLLLTSKAKENTIKNVQGRLLITRIALKADDEST